MSSPGQIRRPPPTNPQCAGEQCRRLPQNNQSCSEHNWRPLPSNQLSVWGRPRRFVRQGVEFSVKGPIAVNLDEHHLTLPGCSVVDLLFARPSKVRELVFRNYYTAWVTIIVRVAFRRDIPSTSSARGEDIDSKWVLSIPHRSLMRSPHVEIGAQDFISIPFYESLVEWDNLLAIRLVLRQPSPTWKIFHVEELNVYSDTPRYTQPAVSYFTAQGASCHIQQYEQLLTLVIKQTIDSLHQKNGEAVEGSSVQKEHVPASYEFFSLPHA